MHRHTATAVLAGTLLCGTFAWHPASPFRFTALAAYGATRVAPAELVRRTVPLREACRQIGVRYPPPNLRLRVRKGSRILSVNSGDHTIKEFPIALGFSPLGDKLRQGDGKTPEGSFYVCTRLTQSRFYRFAGISYPAAEDGRRGLQAGQITRAEARAIETAHKKRRLPPWNTALGGAVGIHGGGAGPDWTLGCIALDDDDIDELFPLLAIGTSVSIEP